MAQTPLELMRSRYSAYALSLPFYIISTTHPQSPHFESDFSQWLQSILAFSKGSEFIKLEILNHGKDSVHFKAYLKQEGKELLLEERSSFLQVEGKWFYFKGERT